MSNAIEQGREALRSSANRGGHILDRRVIEDLVAECERRIDPDRLRAIADAVDGEKAAYLIAYQRGDWGVYAAREYGDLGRASTAAEAIEAAERTLGADA